MVTDSQVVLGFSSGAKAADLFAATSLVLESAANQVAAGECTQLQPEAGQLYLSGVVLRNSVLPGEVNS